ncbi:uncharacterized protein V1510DRAFT_419867 [Dipodascopsis tothii]|uniref:uncharacterized protein n=1 Tax=Dipodascopsis tothii TaxID=44089 RepID=UPI0034CD4ABC
MESDYSRAIEMITRGSEAFIQLYYKSLDENRSIIASFYEPASPIVYNGNPISGGEMLAQMYANMPVTTHEVGSFDCHPLAAGVNGQPSIALTVSGKVRIGADKAKRMCGYSESFILKPQMDGKFYISTSCYRLVHRPDDVDIEP